jgi:hypothetical protein
MYSTCTFCHATLGANEMLEAFPVGRRLAFDAAKGRLWVVCPTCRQWNLSPLDERWEAIESAERLYRDTKLRAATEQVGLARLRDGSELIRIGAPLRPEFAAWRYGERFTTRWRRYTALSAVFGGGALLVSPLAGLGFSMLPYYRVGIVKRAIDKRRVIARASDEKGGVAFTLADARLARVFTAPDEPLGWALSVPGLRVPTAVGRFLPLNPDFAPRVTLRGDAALDVVRRIIPHVNEAGARRNTVQEAVRVLEETGAMRETFARAAQTVGRDGAGDPSRDLQALPPSMRLALEMAAHEDVERRALEGELAALEAEWRAAEEIAAIADTLTLPEWMADRLGRLSGG